MNLQQLSHWQDSHQQPQHLYWTLSTLSLSHMNFNLGYLNWPFLKCQFVLRPLFGWMHSCLFNITPTPFILTLFISSWDSSDQNVFLCRARSIFVVGMILCLRDSTRTDFHTDSFGISTLLGTSSSLAASTGIVHKSLANNMDGKRRRMGENKRLCLIVNKWIPARSAAEKTDTFCLWKGGQAWHRIQKGKEAFRGESVIDKKHPLNIRSMPAFWGISKRNDRAQRGESVIEGLHRWNSALKCNWV